MKKIFFILAIVTLITSTLVFGANAEEALKVKINGEYVQFDAQPFIDENNRTLVPVRFIAEKLGAKVDWNGETRTVSVDTNSKSIKLVIDQKQATVNGNIVELDTKAIIKESRTFVPLRFIAESMDLRVKWNGETRTVELETSDYEVAIKDITEFGSRPVTDFIEYERPYFINDDGKIELIENVYISSYSDLPLIMGDKTVYAIDTIEHSGEKVLRIKLNKDSSGVSVFYIKNGNETASKVEAIKYIDKNGEKLTDKNSDGTYNIYYSLEEAFCNDKNSPNALNSDYIILSNSKNAVLIDNVFKK